MEFGGVVYLINLIWRVLFLEEEYNLRWKNRDLNFRIALLVILIYLMIIRIKTGFGISVRLIFILLLNLIMVGDILYFFFMYEIVFIFIMFRIMFLGYRYERLIASLLIIFYSFIFSRPVIIIVIIFDKTFLIKEWLQYRMILRYFFVGSFLVKFPIFGFHYWLPVAHVEASTIGSILLAGLLLKLGAVGFLYVIRYMKFIVKLHWLVLSVAIVILIILRLRDLKIIIAYSSIAHITITFYISRLGTFIGKKGAIYLIFYHGYISPLIFWIVGLLGWWKTRSLSVVKLITFSYSFLIFLFIVLILNIRFPPFIGFLSEVLILKAMVGNIVLLGVMILRVLVSCYYNVYLYWCFRGVVGVNFKLRFFNLDLFMFVLIRVFLRFY